MTERLPWFRCFPSKLLGALAGMQAEEGFVYVTILLRIYETAGPVGETPRTLARRTGLSEKKVKAALESLIGAGKVLLLEGRLDSDTTHAEIAWQNVAREGQIKAGKTSAEKRAIKTQQNQQDRSTSVQRALNHKEKDLEEEPNGSMSETEISDAPQKPSSKRKGVYPETFETVWRDYPTDPNMSKKDAFVAWGRLDELDRAAVAASVPAFKAYCAANPTYRPVHMVRYLTSRRFDGFAPAVSATTAPVEDRRWHSRLALARAQRSWSAREWGPPPGKPGCKAPEHLLEPSDGQNWEIAA